MLCEECGKQTAIRILRKFEIIQDTKEGTVLHELCSWKCIRDYAKGKADDGRTENE